MQGIQVPYQTLNPTPNPTPKPLMLCISNPKWLFTLHTHVVSCCIIDDTCIVSSYRGGGDGLLPGPFQPSARAWGPVATPVVSCCI